MIGAFCFGSGDLKPEPAKGFCTKLQGIGFSDFKKIAKMPPLTITIFFI